MAEIKFKSLREYFYTLIPLLQNFPINSELKAHDLIYLLEWVEDLVKILHKYKRGTLSINSNNRSKVYLKLLFDELVSLLSNFKPILFNTFDELLNIKILIRCLIGKISGIMGMNRTRKSY